MRVRFFPRDVGMFRNGDFDFSLRSGAGITLEARTKYDFKDFYDRNELIEYLKTRGVRLDDEKYPLEFRYEPEKHILGSYIIIQWTVLGWMEEII